MNFNEAATLIKNAKRPEDVFGERIDDHDRWAADAKATFKKLGQIVHPDIAQNQHYEPTATDVFARLSELWEQAQRTSPGASFTITTKRRTYEAGKLAARGSVANLYACTYFPDVTSGDAVVDDLLRVKAKLKGDDAPASESDELRDALLKMPRDPRNNDLMVAESKAIGMLRADTTRNAKLGAFIPELVESFQHRDKSSGKQRLCNVFDKLDGFYTLTDVRRINGWIHPKDVAWMWHRLLVALHFAHTNGIIHGAVVPDNVMIHPEEHGLVLIDWCYSVQATRGPALTSVYDPGHAPTAHLVAKIKTDSSFYPPFGYYDPAWDPKSDPAPMTTIGFDFDIYMATKTIASLMDPDTLPRGFKGFIKLCTQTGMGPTDALALRDQFLKLIEEMWGPRTFRPFRVG